MMLAGVFQQAPRKALKSDADPVVPQVAIIASLPLEASSVVKLSLGAEVAEFE